MRSHSLLRLVGTGLALCALNLAVPSQAQMPPGAGGPKQVGVVTVRTEAVPLSVTSPGRAVAPDEIAIRPQVGGVVSEVLYTPGQPIGKGDPMFRIDPGTYQAAVAEAEANLASANAAVLQAQAAFDRAKALQNSGSTRAALEEAEATRDQAQAAVKAAEAALTVAQIQLSWTTITSPLDGLPSISAVSPGDLVTAGQSDALATVTRLDPIDVDMYEPSARLQRLRDRIESGEIATNESLRAELTLENGVIYAATGEMVAPGYTVSTTTGAIDFRFRFDNPERRILPGMFVRGTVELGQIEAVLVPQLAATRGRDGLLSAWVAEDGKAVKRTLNEEGVHDNAWIVTSGLGDGDLLIVNGITGLTEGAEVQTTPVTVDADGVVKDADQAEDASATPDPTPAASATVMAEPAAAPTSVAGSAAATE